MTARDELIKAYAFYTLRKDSAGDYDMGAAITHDPVRRKAQVRECGKVKYKVDPYYFSDNNQKAVDTTRIVGAACRAGKIISAAEGEELHTQAYSRVYYSDSATNKDKAQLAHYLTKILRNRLGGRGHLLVHGYKVIVAFSKSKEPDHNDIMSNSLVYDVTRNLIINLDKGCLKRVSNWLSIDTHRENEAKLIT